MKAPAELWTVARALGELTDEVVFVGGMIRELLITDLAAGPARATQDVDCIVNAASRAEYYQLTDRLRARGFAECTDEGAPLCRWTVNGVPVDVMPVDPEILGYSNVWYPSGIDHAIREVGPDGSIRIVDAVHFLATKIESFLSRAEGDFYHHDMEDLIAIIDGRPELPAEVAAAPKDLREFIAGQMAEWLADKTFIAALSGNLAGDAASQARRPIVLSRMQQIAALLGRRAQAIRRAKQLLGPSLRGGPAAPLPARVILQSSNLRAAEYDAAARRLLIELNDRSRYEYAGVPENIYAGLLRASSHGKYFHQWIRDRYPHRQLA
ncbi:MAG: KTSC domain-containing protein [Myxococcales bacterium]|nr:KTSC domain-containing protein [Myxococcales bacterium]